MGAIDEQVDRENSIMRVRGAASATVRATFSSMEKLAASRVTHLYSLMDSAYDAADIRNWINACGRKPIIDANKRIGGTAETMDPATKRRYAIRSTVERSNADLKDWLLPLKLLVKGHKKVSFCLFSGVDCLAAVKILQQLVLPELEAAA